MKVVELNRLFHTEEIINYVDVNETTPRLRSKYSGSDEKRLGSKLSSYKKVHRDGKLNNSVLTLLQEHGKQDILLSNQIKPDVDNQLNNISIINQFHKTTHRFPKLRSKNKIERSIAILHNNLKASHRNSGSIQWNDLYMKEAIKLGIPHMFDKKYNIGCSLDYLKNINNFIQLNNRLPTSKSPSQMEAEIGRQLSFILKLHKEGSLQQKSLDYIKINNMNLFDNKNNRTCYIRATELEKNDFNIIKAVVRSFSINGRLPRTKSKHMLEVNLAYRFRRLKRMYRDGILPQKYIDYSIALGKNIFYKQFE